MKERTNVLARTQRGFTLLEVVVVLAVLGATAIMIAPVAFRYIDDANRTRAQNDVTAIAAAINQFYKDTGRYPFYADGRGAISYTDYTDAYVLSSNEACNGSGYLQDLDTTRPEQGSSTLFYDRPCDSLAAHLVKNTPMGASSGASTTYLTTGNRAWKGPYLENIPALDPWGRSYLVNIRFSDPNIVAPNPRYVVAISAGANGTLDTDLDTGGTSNPAAGADDIVARVK